jgi:hypothetical protein
MLRRDTIVLMANEFARDVLNQEIHVSKSFVEKCGFGRTPGLNIKEDRDRTDRRAPIMVGGSRFSGASRSGEFKRNDNGSKGPPRLFEKVQRELGNFKAKPFDRDHRAKNSAEKVQREPGNFKAKPDKLRRA